MSLCYAEHTVRCRCHNSYYRK